jgi:hypothetical protein
LDDNIMVSAALGVEMPEPDGVDGSLLLEVDLNPLEAV